MATIPRDEPKPVVSRPLTKKQRNDVFRWVRAAGWSPSEFRWGMAEQPRGNDILAALVYHADEQYLFAIDPYGRGDMSVHFVPGVDEILTTEEELDWADIEAHVTDWLGALRVELDEPDLWAELASGAELVAPGDPDHNEPFTKAEVRAIGKQIDDVRGLLESAELATETLAEVNRKLDYLVTATSRLGRFDWRNLAVGVLFDVAVAAAFDPARAREMFEMLLGSVRVLIGGG